MSRNSNGERACNEDGVKTAERERKRERRGGRELHFIDREFHEDEGVEEQGLCECASLRVRASVREDGGEE